MDSLKNKRIKEKKKEKLCRIDNKKVCERERLATIKSKKLTRYWHLLKNRKVKLHKLKFISDEFNNFFSDVNLNGENSSILSRRYFADQDHADKEWSNLMEIVNWLREQGFVVRHISSREYQINAKIYSERAMILFVNRERIKKGLAPFLIPDLTEY